MLEFRLNKRLLCLGGNMVNDLFVRIETKVEWVQGGSGDVESGQEWVFLSAIILWDFDLGGGEWWCACTSFSGRLLCCQGWVSFAWEAWWLRPVILDNLPKKGAPLGNRFHLCSNDEGIIGHLLLLCRKLEFMEFLIYVIWCKIGEGDVGEKYIGKLSW